MKPQSIVAAVAFVALAAVSCSQDPQKAKLRYVESGDKYAAQKNYAEAIVQYRNAIAKDSLFGEARFKLAQAYAATGDVKNAFHEYIRAADLLPDSVEAQMQAGKMLLLAGQFPEAKARAVAALESNRETSMP